MFELLRKLLPVARPWWLSADKPLRRWLSGVSEWATAVRAAADRVWLDLLPQETEKLDKWEAQFGLNPREFAEHIRRDRVEAAWQDTGSLSPHYIKNVLDLNQFSTLHVHEWWVPGTEPAPGETTCATPRDPRQYLRNPGGVPSYGVQIGSGVQFGSGVQAQGAQSLTGYALANGVTIYAPKYRRQVGRGTQAGSGPQFASNEGFEDRPILREIPSDPAKWVHFWYVGGVNFGELALVPSWRREELETLVLKHGPRRGWVGMIVEYF
jgi:hypothetical protein